MLETIINKLLGRKKTVDEKIEYGKVLVLLQGLEGRKLIDGINIKDYTRKVTGYWVGYHRRTSLSGKSYLDTIQYLEE